MKNSQFQFVFAFLAAYSVLTGCSPEVQEVPKGALVSVDGRFLTEGDVERSISFRLGMFGLKDERRLKALETRLRRDSRRVAIPNFMERVLLSEYAATNGISLAEEEFGEHVRLVAKSCKAKNLDDLMARIDAPLRTECEAELREEALVRKVRGIFESSAGISVDDAEVAAAFDRLERINAAAAATNALIYARATNVWSEITAEKVDFAAAITRYSEGEEKESGGEWGPYSESDLSGEDAILDCLKKGLAVGGVTMPVESDNGLVIVQLVERLERDGVPVYSMRRIYFRLAELWEVPDAAKMKSVLAGNKMKRAYGAFLKGLKASARIRRFYKMGNEMGDER